MPSIDFYLIPQEGPEARLLFACRLLEKAYTQKHQIYVHVDTPENARALDNLLWTFRDNSFIPHQLLNDAMKTPSSPILIGYQTTTLAHPDILLNLHHDIPTSHNQFNRILEIMGNEPHLCSVAEEHRVFYEEKGYKTTTHQLNK